MKLCEPCLKALEHGEGRLCLRCRRGLAPFMEEASCEEPWPEFWVPDAECVGVAGMSGMGKSTFEKAWTAFLMERGVPVYWMDLMREASCKGIPRARAPLGPLLEQVTVSELEARNWIEWVPEGAAAQALAIVTDSERPTRAQRAENFVRAMRQFIADKPKEEDCVLFLAECGLLEGESAAEEMLEEIANTWRKEGVSVVFDTQAVSMVPERARRQWKTVVAFKQVDVNDRTALTRLATRRFAEAVSELPPHACLVADRMNLAAWKENREPGEAGAEEAA